jgi:hypothetical protein
MSERFKADCVIERERGDFLRLDHVPSGAGPFEVSVREESETSFMILSMSDAQRLARWIENRLAGDSQ